MLKVGVHLLFFLEDLGLREFVPHSESFVSHRKKVPFDKTSHVRLQL